MPQSTLINAAICVSVVSAGVGVAVAGALLDPKDVYTRSRRNGEFCIPGRVHANGFLVCMHLKSQRF